MSERKFGIDISLYQKGFDFEKAIKEGVEFAVIKASQSQFKDPEFEKHYVEANIKGIKTGAYHYLTATSTTDAEKQAKYMIDNCLRGKIFDYPIFADAEDKVLKALDKNTVTSIIKKFCDTLESAGYWAGFYCNKDFYRNNCNGGTLAKRYSLWIASWTNDIDIDCQMWQFGGETNLLRTNKVAGVVCDQNYSFMDYPTLIKAKGLNGYTSKNEPQKQTVKTSTSGFSVGDTVILDSKATIYGTDKKFASWVYNSTLYVREINGSRVVISTLKSGDITGAVDLKFLRKM